MMEYNIEKMLAASKNSMAIECISKNLRGYYYKWDLTQDNAVKLSFSPNKPNDQDNWINVKLDILSIKTYYYIDIFIGENILLTSDMTRSVILQKYSSLSIRQVEFILGLLQNLDEITIIGKDAISDLNQIEKNPIIIYTSEEIELPEFDNINLIIKRY